jgi:hypothetical protein
MGNSTKIIDNGENKRILSEIDEVPISGAVVGRKEEELEFVHPHLLYKELIALLVISVFLIIVSILFNAPLLELANPFKTENPAKAPWYFVGLQELLVYFDPWIAGVVLPLLILAGLTLIPYLDDNPKGVGKYTFSERKFAIFNFIFGFILWWVLIFIGWFLRGPNWQFYWIGESWKYGKPLATELKNLSLFVGVIFITAYVFLGMVLPRFAWRNYFKLWSMKKYVVVMGFILLMYGVVLKMILRIFFNIRYILVTPWFNI